MSILMNTENQNFENILGNGAKYKVPRFQRDYSWSDEQWEDLWVDIDTLNEEKQHYMGYLVLQTGTGDRQLIIDGQQRLTTLSIMVLSAIKILTELAKTDPDNQTRAEAIRARYIGTIDTVSLLTYNKLELNRNNDATFKRLSSLKELPIRKVKKTNKLMKDAFDFFYEKLKHKNGKDIAELIATMSKGLIFTKISVDNEINAYKVFETLNARGVQLSTPDLLKNYLFSIISKHGDVTVEEMNRLDESWEEIVEQLGKESFADFLRTDWNSKHKTVTKNALFKEIRNNVSSREDVYDYLEELGKRSQIYAALFLPDDEIWQNNDYKECSKDITVFKLFSIKQPFNIFLAAYDAFSPKEFTRLMKYIVILSIRYNTICARSTKEQERIYNTIALNITSGKYKRASHVKNSDEFKKLYPSDEDFIATFKTKHMPHIQTKKKIRYILAEIENHVASKHSAYEDVTIEHILPEHPTEKWITSFGDEWDDSINRLGNMVLLSKEDNKAIGTAIFEEKKKVYCQSGFSLATQIGGYDSWNLENLNKYQSWLAEQAVKTWAIN